MDQKLFKIAQNGPKRPKIAQNGPKLFPSLSLLQLKPLSLFSASPRENVGLKQEIPTQQKNVGKTGEKLDENGHFVSAQSSFTAMR